MYKSQELLVPIWPGLTLYICSWDFGAALPRLSCLQWPYMAWYWRHRGGYSSTGNTCKESGSPECDCTVAHLGIQVLFIYMTHLETVSIRYCVKKPVTKQLIQLGFFTYQHLSPTIT